MFGDLCPSVLLCHHIEPFVLASHLLVTSKPSKIRAGILAGFLNTPNRAQSSLEN